MIQLRVVTEEKEVFSGEADKIVAPGSEGEFTVLPQHVPFLTTLKKGVVTIGAKGNNTYIEVEESGVFELCAHNMAVILLSSHA
jgi:F-type H+-transporting ATPase subunit epsilon